MAWIDKTRWHGLVLVLLCGLCLPQSKSMRVYAQSPSKTKSESIEIPSPPLVWSHWDTLFIIAATGEPRWQALRDSSEKELLATPDSTVPFLLSRRMKEQTPRQRRYVERLFDLLSDSGRHAAPGKSIRVALDSANDSLKPELLYMASTMGDSNLLDLGRRYLGSPSTSIRKMAARVLGMIPRPESAAELFSRIEEFPEPERHQRVWALAAIAPYPGCEGLRHLANDSSLAVRQMVAHALSRCADKKFASLNLTLPRLKPQEMLPVTPWLTFLEAALETATPESLRYAQDLLAHLPPETRRFYEAEPNKVYTK